MRDSSDGRFSGRRSQINDEFCAQRFGDFLQPSTSGCVTRTAFDIFRTGAGRTIVVAGVGADASVGTAVAGLFRGK